MYRTWMNPSRNERLAALRTPEPPGETQFLRNKPNFDPGITGTRARKSWTVKVPSTNHSAKPFGSKRIST